MSTTIVESSRGASSSAGHRRSARPWLREPLLHFVILGAVLFSIDAAFASREDDPHTIVIDAQVDAQAIDVFKNARGRDPNSEELYALRKVWLDNEVLYREGLSLGLDRGDKAIRERVIFKALSMVDAGVKLPPYDENVLRTWFENNRPKYDEPARYNFEEAVVTGDRTEGAVRAFAQGLNAGTPGDIDADLRVFTARPHHNIVQSYGADFATALASAPVGEWQALPSSSGLRVVHLKSVTASSPAVFENLAGVVLQDWTDSVMAEQRSAAVRTLAKKYDVQVKGTKP
ncbi:MAG TPA: peptidylprolyl isomerase [Steroidobacteraceae bacterium]|nr:peptidylprolyl isomerase [Steroidobacteraceae bacterium]